ncbi:MAG TPA: response regulator [Candidatus Binatia bacterium]|jgi:two-component system cell cycle response regulator/two-component system cell cycle response regulator DivK
MSKKRILLVEDNPATVDVVQKELEFLGYDAITADTGDKAVQMAETHLPDLIIMDISLPGMDGLQATALIRKNPKTQSIPVLAATARALPGDREKCMQSGCTDYIAKPFTHRELGAALKKILKED